MKTKYALALSSLLIMVAATSCVSPGDFDGTEVTRYQQTMVSKSPQPRSSGRLGPLQQAPGTTGPQLRVDTDKTGQSFIYLSLDEAVQRALANSVEIQVLSFEPAISREQAIQAAAQFDYILFGATSYERADPPSLIPGVNSQTSTTNYQLGVRQRTITGATWQFAPTLTRVLDDSTTATARNRYQPSLAFQVEQPLLRNAWPEVNLAQLRISQLNYRNTVAQFRQRVEEVINNVINAYWGLLQARVDVEIQEELLRRTEETRDRIKQRVEIDATLVELKQAEAAVESRRAILIRARKTVGDAQDQLARLVSDAQINAISPYEIIPTTPPPRIPIEIDPADQLALALIFNPQLEQARLAISAAQIQVRVARNQTLPRLDLQASANVAGLDTEFHESQENLFTFDNLGYSLGLVLEYPIGNREAIALWRQRQYEVGRAISTLQNLSDRIAVDIRERIRQIQTSYKEMQATRLAVEASAAQLEALNTTERVRGRLTPEFLQVKLQAQESLANSRRAELAAIINYNQAMADLARATGTMLRQYGISVEKLPNVLDGRPWQVRQGSEPARPIDLRIPGQSATYELPVTTSQADQ